MSEMVPEKMKVAELREALEARGLDIKGTKPFLVERLKEALAQEEGGEAMQETEDGANGDNGDMEEDEDEEMEQDEEAGDEDEDAEMNGDEEAAAPETNGVSEDKVKAEEEEEGKGVKRKLEEPEELKPWIVREDEPEIDENLLCLDWYNSDLNLKIKHDDFMTALPMTRDLWSWVYAGARATFGFNSGKIYFEAKIVELLRVSTERDGFHYDLRAGWSLNDTPLQLGETPSSWCYSGNAGKKVHNSVFEDMGEKLELFDVLGCFLDLDSDMVTMSWTKNGKPLEGGYSFPKADLGGKALFPHILSRNIKFECNFGKNKKGEETKVFKEVPETLQNYTRVALVPEELRVRGTPRIATREECEMILMVGLPSSGKTTWAKNYAAAHPEKKYEIINATLYLERATCNGDSRKNHCQLAWDKAHHRLTKTLLDVIKVASSRRRNIILDQTNVYSSAQLRKARPFEKMNRKCVVIVPSDEEWEKRRAQQEADGEKNIPDDAVMEMKANLGLPDADQKVFSEVIFTELQRDEAQTLIEQYNKEAKEKGFGKKQEEAKSRWEASKRGRFHSRGRSLRGNTFGRGGPMRPARGFGMMGMAGGMRGRGGGGGWGNPWGAFGGGGMVGYGGGWGNPWGTPAQFNRGGGGAGGHPKYPGRKNWGGWGR